MTRSRTLFGLSCAASTVFLPAKVPMSAPSATSLPQCLLWYMRDRPTSVAPPYISVPMYGVDLGHQTEVSSVTADAAANAVLVWPDGNDCQSPLLKPRPQSKSWGMLSPETKGRLRPIVPLRTYVMPCATRTASVPCHPRSAIRGIFPTRPTT